MEMVGIIFSNIYDNAMADLTYSRTVASLPFGGRYRQIDFVLSNMVNSGISRVGIITKYNYQSLMDHLGSCAEWDLNNKNGGVYLLPPFITGQTGVYRGKLEALHVALNFLSKRQEEYVLLSDSTTICNIDYTPVLEEHIASGSDVTVIAHAFGEADRGVSHDLLLHADDTGTVTDMAVDVQEEQSGSLVGMGMFLMKREQLIEVIQTSVARDLHHFEREFLLRRFRLGNLAVHVSKFDGVVLRNDSVTVFFKNNLRLMEERVRKDLFRSDRPVYTKVRDEIPSFYGEDSVVNDCIIADGCRIEGNVERAVLFRDVKIGSHSFVKNCVIMQGTVIGENCRLENVILDKDVTVCDGVELKGVSTSPIVIKKGKTVEE